MLLSSPPPSCCVHVAALHITEKATVLASETFRYVLLWLINKSEDSEGAVKQERLAFHSAFPSTRCILLNSSVDLPGHRTKRTIARTFKRILGGIRTHKPPPRHRFPEHLVFDSGFCLHIKIYWNLLCKKRASFQRKTHQALLHYAKRGAVVAILPKSNR